MSSSPRHTSWRAVFLSHHVLLAACAVTLIGCGGDSDAPGGGALPEDALEAYAALEPNCGTARVGLTPLSPQELLAEPWAIPTDAHFTSAHAKRPSDAQPAWLPSAGTSALSARHPVLESDLVNPEGDRDQCLRAMALFSESDTVALAGGRERRTRVYFTQTVERFEAPTPEVALASEGARVAAQAFSAQLHRLVVEGGAGVWEEKQRGTFPIRLKCEQGLELASRLHGYTSEEYAAALADGTQSGQYCETRGELAVCVGYAPQPTLDGCTLVLERAALTTAAGRAFHASLAGKLALRGSEADPYYELSIDQVRVE